MEKQALSLFLSSFCHFYGADTLLLPLINCVLSAGKNEVIQLLGFSVSLLNS